MSWMFEDSRFTFLFAHRNWQFRILIYLNLQLGINFVIMGAAGDTFSRGNTMDSAARNDFNLFTQRYCGLIANEELE